MTTDGSPTIDGDRKGGPMRRKGGSWVTALVFVVAIFAALWIMLGSGARLLDSVVAAFKSPVTWVVAVAVFFLGAVAAYAQRAGKRAAMAVEEASRFLKGMQSPDNRERGVDPATMALANARMGEVRHAGDLFRDQWDEFEESLVTRDGRFFNTMEAGRFFTDADFESSVKTGWLGISYSFIHEIPGFMTSLGMLGTFVGIALGLGELGGDSSHVIDNIGGVITGLASAFWTSIFGLIGAALTIWLNHKTDARCVNAMSEFRLSLDRLVPRATSEFYLERQGSELAQLRELQTDAVKLARNLPELKELQEQSTTYLHTMANDLAEQIATGTGKVILSTLEPLLQRVTEVIENQVQNAAESSREAIAEMAGALASEFRDALEGSVTRIGEQTEQMVTSFERVSASLDTHVGDAVGALTTGFETAATSIVASFDTAGESLEESASRASASLASASRGMSTALEGASAGLSTALAGAGEGLSAALQSAIGGAQEGMSELATSMVATMRDATETMNQGVRDAIAPLTTALQALHTITQNLDGLTRSQTVLLERYMAVSSELRAAASELAPALEGLQSHDEVLGEALTSIGALLEGLAATHDDLITASDELRSGLQDTSENLAESVSGLKEMASEFAGWTQATSSSIQQFADSMSGSVKVTLTEFDGALTNAVRQISAAGQSLTSVAEEISEKAERIVRAS